jgi:GntR family transcriptional repressor for pyruvate dehydrogenase complex
MTESEIRPLEKTTFRKSDVLYGQIFERIREWIRIGKLKEGDPLPSERELAEMFDVSRVPVREAIKVLEFVGVVQRVQGKGVFVKKISVGNIIENLDFTMMDPKHTLLEIFEVREGIEIQAAYLAALRRTEEDLALIESALQGTTPGDRPDFHSAVIVASHNLAIFDINKFLVDWLYCLREHFLKGSATSEKGLRDHTEIYNYIKVGDGWGAARKMQEHLERAKNDIAEAMRQAGMNI